MPSISTVAICNMALSHIGAHSSIEDIAEASAEAEACSKWFDWSRVQTLAPYKWNFARRRAALALHGDAAPTGVWTYRYALPDGYVRARYIENSLGWAEDAVPFELETSDDGSENTILTDQRDATLVYTFDQTDATMWSPEFVDALAWRLAANIAFEITRDRGIAKDCDQRFYQLALPMAVASNANESRPRGPRDAEGIRARA